MKFIKNIFIIVGLLAWITSCILSINFLVEIFCMTVIWMIIGAFIGLGIDLGKLGATRWWIISNDKRELALATMIVTILLSLAATFGALQSNLEKNAMKSPEYISKAQELAALDFQIENKKLTAQRYGEMKYLRRGDAVTESISPLIAEKDRLAKELRTIRTSASGSSGAIFRAISNTFHVNIYYVALAGNFFVAALMEWLGIVANIFLFSGIRKRYKTDTSTDDDDDELSGLELRQGKTGLELVNKQGKKIPFPVADNNSNEPEYTEKKTKFGFQPNQISEGNINLVDSLVDKNQNLVDSLVDKNQNLVDEKSVNVDSFLVDKNDNLVDKKVDDLVDSLVDKKCQLKDDLVDSLVDDLVDKNDKLVDSLVDEKCQLKDGSVDNLVDKKVSTLVDKKQNLVDSLVDKTINLVDTSKPKKVNLNVNVRKITTRKSGKSDKMILQVYDHWNRYSNGRKRTFGNIAKAVCENGYDVSRQYCHRIIKNKR